MTTLIIREPVSTWFGGGPLEPTLCENRLKSQPCSCESLLPFHAAGAATGRLCAYVVDNSRIGSLVALEPLFGLPAKPHPRPLASVGIPTAIPQLRHQGLDFFTDGSHITRESDAFGRHDLANDLQVRQR